MPLCCCPKDRKPKPPTSTPSAASEPNAPLPSPITKVLLDSYDAYDWNHSADALTDWLNARWKKTGFQVSRETVCFTLRANGRDAEIGTGDRMEGAFCRAAARGGSEPERQV
ncbi:hypothetical protein BAUCODRAFT_329308 [Baudoinia panamericana UAMH 10762]|uniref:Uncharacterized protein n=1 Tax=Baudoinia panamericana (strain UAMH 10762) TaxID=717646 RepID=M2MXQ9_BAUPA|nr:uncharacterized protein BAUCODRAFT_329308 [Baudoinia panamericana UAMH 10762]EMC91454.1 hypothetical protein BAUCODRAFT_329308 [Baudoinia panamericana UAMH 10762]